MSNLSDDEAQELTNQLSQLANSGASLSEGLRASAAESDNPRVSKVLQDIASQLEQGRPLVEVLQSSSSSLPAHIRGLIVAGIRSGRLGDALSDLLDIQRTRRSVLLALSRAVAYPILVAFLTALVLVFVLQLTTPVRALISEFNLRVPLITEILFWWRDIGIWVLVAAVLLIIIGSLGIRWWLGRVRWMRLIATVPVLGPLIHWMGIAEWAGLASVLIRHQLPLPEAFRLSAAGVQNEYVGYLSQRWAEGIEQGQRISDLLADSDGFPRSLTPLIRWGEATGQIDTCLSAARNLLDRRVLIRSAMLQSILPPLLFLIIGCAIVMVILGLYVPAGSLLGSLGV